VRQNGAVRPSVDTLQKQLRLRPGVVIMARSPARDLSGSRRDFVPLCAASWTLSARRMLRFASV